MAVPWTIRCSLPINLSSGSIIPSDVILFCCYRFFQCVVWVFSYTLKNKVRLGQSVCNTGVFAFAFSLLLGFFSPNSHLCADRLTRNSRSGKGSAGPRPLGIFILTAYTPLSLHVARS